MYIIVVIFLAILFLIAILAMFYGKKTSNSDWVKRLSKHFERIEFPILVVRPNSRLPWIESIDVVETLEEYVNDPDLSFHEFPLGTDLIDSKGNRYVWLYDQDLHVNIPSEKGDPVSFEEFKCLVVERFPKLQQVQYTPNESFSTLMQRIIRGL